MSVADKGIAYIGTVFIYYKNCFQLNEYTLPVARQMKHRY